MTVVPRRWHRMSLSGDPAAPFIDTGRWEDLSTGEMRAVRNHLRRERHEIHAAAIEGGPTDVLCERLNALEGKERLLAQAVKLQRDRRPGGVRGILGAIRL